MDHIVTLDDFLNRKKVTERREIQTIAERVKEAYPILIGKICSTCLIDPLNLIPFSIGVKEFYIYLDFCIQEYAQKTAEGFSIKNFKGTRFEELEILKKHFVKKIYKNIGLEEF